MSEAQVKRTILIVNSSPVERELYRGYLLKAACAARQETSFSYDFWEAESGNTALEMCSSKLPDCIILNYILSDRNGLDLLVELKKCMGKKCPPVIMLNDRDREEIAIRAFKTGVTDYLIESEITPESLCHTTRMAIERKVKELEIQKANERFELAAAAVNSIIYDWDLPTDRVDRTRGLLEVTGYSLEEAEPTAQWWFELIHPDDLARKNRERVSVELVKRDRYNMEYRVRHKDGHYIWVEDWGRVIKNESGQPMRIVGSCRNISDRKHMEAQLRESEERWQFVLQGNHDGIWDRDLQTNYLYLSDRCLEIVGYAAEELRNFSQWLSYIHPDDLNRMQNIWQRHLNRETENYSCEYRVRCKNGEYKWLLVRGKAYWDDRGNRVRALGSMTDITERKHSESIANQQLAQLEAIYATAPIGLCFLDRERKFLQINERLAAMNGLPVSEHIGRTVGEILPELAAVQEPIFERVFQTGLPILDVEIRGTTPAQPEVDRYWLVSYCPLTEKDGRVSGVNITVMEITERQQAEAALKESEQRLQAIIDNSKAAIFMKDLQGRYLLMNCECERLFQVTNDEIRGKTDYDLFAREIADVLRDNDRQVLDAGTALTLEEKIPLEDGTHTYIAVKFPLFDNRGVPYAICGVSTDISDRVRLQAERDRLLAEAQAARAAAEAANSSKDEFVAVVAHELRSPINSVAGWAQLLRTKNFDRSNLDRALDAIARGTQTQVQLIEDLLDISRLACGTLRLTFAPVNLPIVMESSLSLVRPMADAKKIRLKTELVTKASVSGDINRLQQIAVNLLTNAIKFTPAGGSVTVKLEMEQGSKGAGEAGKQKRQLGESSSYAQIIVSDTGKGIAPEFLPQIFDRFQQGQKNSGAKDGLGLGLAIVKNLVELHHGSITAESQGVGLGSIFTVWLPLLQEERETGNRKQNTLAMESQIAPLTGIRILAVDDEPDSLELLRFILENAGAEVQTAPSGSTALEILTRFNPNLLVSDISMPDMNGNELLQQIKTIYREREIMAIALTAYASSNDRDYSLRIGFDRYFSKPIEPNFLIRAITSLLQNS
jgi:PAS domain S-box-containing protein